MKGLNTISRLNSNQKYCTLLNLGGYKDLIKDAVDTQTFENVETFRNAIPVSLNNAGWGGVNNNDHVIDLSRKHRCNQFIIKDKDNFLKLVTFY